MTGRGGGRTLGEKSVNEAAAEHMKKKKISASQKKVEAKERNLRHSANEAPWTLTAGTSGGTPCHLTAKPAWSEEDFLHSSRASASHQYWLHNGKAVSFCALSVPRNFPVTRLIREKELKCYTRVEVHFYSGMSKVTSVNLLT